MPRKKDTQEYTWKDLEGHIAPAVLCAPRTGSDPTSTWPQVHPRVIGDVVGQVLANPWADHLVLICAVCAAQRRDVGTIEQVVSKLHARFSSLFLLFELTSVHQWSLDQHLVPYVRGAASSQDPLATRVDFFQRYMGATNLVASWLDFLPVAQQEPYRAFLLPTINPFLAEEFAKLVKEAHRQQKEQRKQETEAVVPQFTLLRAEAHFRFNRMTRLWQA
jgi:hypothetical protein